MKTLDNFIKATSAMVNEDPEKALENIARIYVVTLRHFTVPDKHGRKNERVAKMLRGSVKAMIADLNVMFPEDDLCQE